MQEARPRIIKESTAPGGVDNRYAPRPKAVDGGIGMGAGGNVSSFDVIDYALK
jgi:hypothetical protein